MSKLYFLSLMTLSYIVGELTHFLINTTSREVAREVEFGEKSCFVNGSFVKNTEEDKEEFDCTESKNETDCEAEKHCYWEYSGLGIQYQVQHRAVTLYQIVRTITTILDKIKTNQFKQYIPYKTFLWSIYLYQVGQTKFGKLNNVDLLAASTPL